MMHFLFVNCTCVTYNNVWQSKDKKKGNALVQMYCKIVVVALLRKKYNIVCKERRSNVSEKFSSQLPDTITHPLALDRFTPS